MQAAAPWPGMVGRIDWTRPWFLPFARIGERIAARVGAGADLRGCVDTEAAARGLRTAAGLPLRFVAQHALPPGTAYETHIFATGAVPTRDNLHDFFNALIWLHFPTAKARLNALQAARIAEQGVQGPRGPVRDGATLFDENAALFLYGAEGHEAALRGFDWHALFVEARDDWVKEPRAHCAVLPFGHALLEKLVTPYKAVTAHAWPLPLTGPGGLPVTPVVDEAQTLDRLDAMLAASLRLSTLHSRAFAPLPVMGIPGWCEGNQDSSFYGDTRVFRLGRRTDPGYGASAGRGRPHR